MAVIVAVGGTYPLVVTVLSLVVSGLNLASLQRKIRRAERDG